MQRFAVLAALVLLAHLIWILWAIFGWVFTRNHPVLTALHIASLLWGVAVEVGPWPCPLTIVEQWLESRAGSRPYQGGFIVRYVDALIYPNLPQALLTWLGGASALQFSRFMPIDCGMLCATGTPRELRRHCHAPSSRRNSTSSPKW